MGTNSVPLKIRIALGVIAALSFTLLSCGGGGADILFDTGNAQDVAYAVLPNAATLPGGDWDTVSYNRKDKGTGETPN
jgi:hypothetical protein